MNRIGDIKGAYRILSEAPVSNQMTKEKRKSYNVVCVSCGRESVKNSKQLYNSHAKLSSGCEKCHKGGGGIPMPQKGRTTICYPVIGGELGRQFIGGHYGTP